MTNNEKLNNADKAIDKAFDIINELAYAEDTSLNDKQRAFIKKAMKQLAHASLNIISARN